MNTTEGRIIAVLWTKGNNNLTESEIREEFDKLGWSTKNIKSSIYKLMGKKLISRRFVYKNRAYFLTKKGEEFVKLSTSP